MSLKWQSWMDGHPSIWQAAVVMCADGVERPHIASLSLFTTWQHAGNLLNRMQAFRYLMLGDELVLGPVKPPGKAASQVVVEPKTAVLTPCAFCKHLGGHTTLHLLLTEPHPYEVLRFDSMFEWDERTARQFFSKDLRDCVLRDRDG